MDGNESSGKTPDDMVSTTSRPKLCETPPIFRGQKTGPGISTGKKDDQAKARVDLLDAEFLLAVGEVLHFGAQKYSAHNWRGGIHVSRLIGSTFRHLLAICLGQDRDSESGLRHTAHLGCNAMFLYWMLINRPDLDDRWKAK